MEGRWAIGRLLLAAASTMAGMGCGSIAIQSSPPEAEVSVLLPGKETPRQLGKTPYTTDLDEVSEIVNEGTIVLVVSKRGYVSQQFVVPNLSSGDLVIEANLLPNLPSNYQEVNHIISRILAAERLLMENRLQEALDAAAEIKKVNENVAAAFEIEGAAYFLKNDLQKSRFAWIRALELEPNNPEAQTTLARIEEKLGIKPAPKAPAVSPAGAAEAKPGSGSKP